MNEGLRAQMEEAALLPEDDVARGEVEEAVRVAGAAAAKMWEDLLREDEALARVLGHVQVPVGLEARLGALPEGSKTPRVARFSLRVRAIAAVLLFAASFGLWVAPPSSDPALEVAELAAANFASDGHASELTADRAALGASLGARLGFDVRLPDLGRGFELRGGRKCALGTNPVAFSAWQGPGGACALYQFRPAEHGLPDDFERQVIRVGGVGERGLGTCCVAVWVHEGRAYAFVSSVECDIRSLPVWR